MLIQPLVQSAGSAALFTNSVSASGVEQAVARAPIAPVQASPDSAGANNGLTRFQTPSAPSASTAANGQPDSQANSASTATDNSPQGDKTQQQQKQQEADQALLDQLKARDQQVRLHEAAHAAVGGQFAGAPSFQYERGPDGRNYAVGGEVGISTSPVKGDPQATIAKARVIRAAALAPAQPSAQDQAVAAAASQMELDAEFQLQQQQTQTSNQEAQAKLTQQDANKEAANKAAFSKDEARKEAALQADQKTADAEARAQEAARKEAVRKEEVKKEYAKELQKEEAAKSANDNIQGANTGQAGVSGTNGQSQSAGSSGNVGQSPSSSAGQQVSKPSGDQKQTNALDRLQKILLGPYDILVQANQKGLVNPQDPYGSSGLLNVFA